MPAAAPVQPKPVAPARNCPNRSQNPRQTQAETKTEACGQPEPKPEPVAEPEPKVAKTSEEEAESQRTSGLQNQPVGAKGIAGDPGKGVHRSGDTDNILNRYLAKVRNTIDYNKQYPHRAKMRRQQGTVKISFVINASGRAEQVEIVESSGSRILDRATTELVARLRFDAPPKDLETIPVKVIAPVDYSLTNS